MREKIYSGPLLVRLIKRPARMADVYEIGIRATSFKKARDTVRIIRVRSADHHRVLAENLFARMDL